MMFLSPQRGAVSPRAISTRKVKTMIDASTQQTIGPWPVSKLPRGTLAATAVLVIFAQASPAALVSRWRFNDPTETNVVSDVQGGGNDLTIFGSPVYTNTPGAFGGCQ